MDTSLLARLERAERNARLIGTATVIVAAAFTWFLTTAATSSKLVARSVVITDPSGRERIVLSTKNGLPYIHLLDASARTRVSLHLVANGERGKIELRNSDSKTVAALFEPTDAPGATMTMYDNDGMKRSSFGISTEGSPSLWFYAPDGRTAQTNMFVNSNGVHLRLNDGVGTLRAYLGVYTDGTYGMSFYNSGGEQTWKQP